ncbi:MAG: CPBP family intramembrane metalloprotease [Candidatus Marinimicrobia bacterium]|nr:CPBP family intramembrane metalloprotease [Candidatus Neomarinimicrobiota bacterium]
MSQYYNYRTALLILFMSLVAYLVLIFGFYYNPSLMGNTPQAVRYILLGVFELLLLFPLLLYVIGNGKSVKHSFRLRPISLLALRDILFIAIGMFILVEFIQYLVELVIGSESFVSADLKVLYPLNYLLLVPVVAIITPFVEEGIFRGYLLRLMLRNKFAPLIAVVLQALLFTVVHLSFRNAPAVFVAGIILGYMAYSFYSIIPGIIIHSIFNILVLVNINVPQIRESILYGKAYVPWLILAGGSLLFLFGIINIRNNVHVHRKRREKEEGVGYEK